MALIRDTGVTLRRIDFSETSQVIAFFTREHGKVRAIGKGIKRSTRNRFATGIDLLEVGDMVLSVRQPRQEALAILTEWKQRQALAGLRAGLARLYAAQYAAEITDALTEDWDPHPALYDGLLGVLGALCEAEAVLPPVVVYQGVLLREIGAWPELDVCVSCRRLPGEQGDLYFSSLDGGLICRDCEAGFAEKRLLERRTLARVRGRTTRPGDAETGDQASGSAVAAFAMLDYHVTHQMGRVPLLAAKLAGRKGRRGEGTEPRP